jgi:hypothetical protein
LSIYGDGYRSRLIEALQNSFPVLAELLGESDFQTMASRYVSAHESTFFNIRWYGDRMSDFLAADSEYSRAPILAEMARLEWAMAHAFDAADATPIDISAFAQVAPEDWAGLRFEWSPSVQVIAVEWNVPQLWKAVTEGGDRPEPAVAPAHYLIWRRELQIYFRALGEEEASVVAAARDHHRGAGRSFGELCVLLCEHLDESEASQHAAGFLRGWVESGLLVGVTSHGEDS